jgi:hypothetical protein
MRSGSPHHAKCHQNLTNSAPHGPNSLGTRSKPLWTFLMIDLTLLLMEEMEKLIEPMTTALRSRLNAFLQQQHHPQLRAKQPETDSTIGPATSPGSLRMHIFLTSLRREE